MLSKLRSYGTVRGLVFGFFGEASADVEELASSAAEISTARSHGDVSNLDPDDLRDWILASLRRGWGLAAVRANARLLLGRLCAVGRGAAAAADRRANQRRRMSLVGPSLRVWR